VNDDDYDYDDRYDMADHSPRSRGFGCSDRMCGAGDCPRCYPGGDPSEDYSGPVWECDEEWDGHE